MTVFVTAVPLRVPRKDALPEGLEARTPCGHVLLCGCNGVATCCFSCPLSRCRYDGGHRGITTILNEVRNTEIAKLRATGLAAEIIASRFHISRRSVFRVLAVMQGNKASVRPLTPLCAPGGEP